MEYKKLLIVGIDPGTTTAYAVLDIEGNLIYLNSSKQLDLNLIISQIIEFGKVILVGTDKVKVPGLVEAFATKFGARIVSPEKDLKVYEKRIMINDFSFNDEHQGDALASALFAYRGTKSLLDKIDFFVKENKKHDIKNRIKELVITKKISIKSAVGLIEKTEEEDKIIEKVVFEKKLSENDFLKLYDKLKKYRTEIKLIKDYNNKLKKKVIDLEKQSKREEPKIDNRRLEDFRIRKIVSLEYGLKSKDRYIEELKSLIKKYNHILSGINNFYIFKKLNTLGINEFNFKNKIINIQRNDILLVDDPNIVSNDVVDLLKNRVFTIVYKKPISKKVENILPFVFINAKNLKIDEDKYFGFVERKNFEIEKNKTDWAKKIIDDYKREKEQLIV
ncbi:DUF460 domain-containing protein [Candidatus Woesearchaeota archaeon]|nr:DUF460 domain-containing protein [Candidatus Woesearchaeota archaeon]